MNLNQIRSRDVIPWIFFKRKSMTENGSASDEFFQVPVEALLNVDKLTEYDDKKVHSDSLICFLNQLQFIRLKEKNNFEIVKCFRCDDSYVGDILKLVDDPYIRH